MSFPAITRFSLAAIPLWIMLGTVSSATPDARIGPGWLGMTFTYHSEDDAKGRPKAWLYIRMIAAGGPAERAGLQVQDVVTAVNGIKLRWRDDIDFLEFLGKLAPGESVKVSVLRAGKPRRVEFTAEKMSDERLQKWKANLEFARQKKLEREKRLSVPVSPQ